jgi:protein-S-isoprenylcysteine O-methyltransferase Ste14
MYLNPQTIATCAITITGAIIATPILIKGFKQRGTGIHESSFFIQRAPQLISLANVVLIVLAFLFYVQLIPANLGGIEGLIVLTGGEAHGLAACISWLGVLILLSGMYFMVGGWYNLGEYFSTDSEILQGQGIRKTGLYEHVMHPIYSGIIQCLIGASLAATSIICLAFALFVVAPLWLRRAKYEEDILVKHLGPGYKEYGEEMKWRRLVPKAFPFGV